MVVLSLAPWCKIPHVRSNLIPFPNPTYSTTVLNPSLTCYSIVAHIRALLDQLVGAFGDSSWHTGVDVLQAHWGLVLLVDIVPGLTDHKLFHIINAGKKKHSDLQNNLLSLEVCKSPPDERMKWWDYQISVLLHCRCRLWPILELMSNWC